MSTDIATAAGFHLVGWLEKNKKPVAWTVGSILILAVVVSFYSWKKGQHEINAGEALSNVRPASDAAQTYLNLANEYGGTIAGGRAILFAAGNSFVAGKYAEAQSQFERLLREYPDSQFHAQALLGVAACLDAQGKVAEATTRYQDLIDRLPNDPATIQARSALARLYELQNQPERALRLYEELARTATYSSHGLLASVLMQDLLARHPELARPKSPASDIKLP
jgi:tetratricopeptide (TPR) repeat protein